MDRPTESTQVSKIDAFANRETRMAQLLAKSNHIESPILGDWSSPKNRVEFLDASPGTSPRSNSEAAPALRAVVGAIGFRDRRVFFRNPPPFSDKKRKDFPSLPILRVCLPA